MVVSLAAAVLIGLLALSTGAGSLPLLLLLSAALCATCYHLWLLRRCVRHRRHTELEATASAEKYRSLFELSSDAIMLFDGQTFFDCNTATLRIFRVGSKAEFCTMHPADLSPPVQPDGTDSKQLADAHVSTALREGSRSFEWVHRRADGTDFPAEVLLSSLQLAGREILQAVVRDITERKQAEESLRSEQRALRRLLKAHDQERKLIAYEIHDGVAQLLSAAVMHCQITMRLAADASEDVTQSCHKVLELLRQSLAETRRLISGVRPPILDEFGLVTAVQNLIDETQQQGGPVIEFRNQVKFDRLEPVLENAAYRIIQEGLNNARRHSRSERLLIELTEAEQSFHIRVQDWGVGFSPDAVDPQRYGLAGMRERIRLLGGTINIISSPGHGTSVLVDLPKEVADLTEGR